MKPITKKGGEPGDVILITKRIGTGALFASEMRGKCQGGHR
jgi:selenophosphate synthase